MAAELLRMLGGAILEALVDGVKMTITQWVSGALAVSIGKLSEAMDSLGGPFEFLGDALSGLGENIESALNRSFATVLNQVADSGKELLGVTRAQTRFIETLETETVSAFEGLLFKMEADEKKAEEDAIAVSDNLLTRMYNVQHIFQETAESTFAGVVHDEEELGFKISESAHFSYDLVQKFMGADIKAAEKLATEQSVRATEAMGNIVDDMVKMETEWFLQTIAVPTANAEGTLWATEQASIVTPDEVMDGLKLQMYTQFKLADDIAKSGLTPTEFIEKEE